MSAIARYLKNLLIAMDQLAGAAILGNEPDMTISAQAWLWHIKGKRHWLYRLIDALFWWDRKGGKAHCEQAFESEREGRQLPPECRPKRARWKNSCRQKNPDEPP